MSRSTRTNLSLGLFAAMALLCAAVVLAAASTTTSVEPREHGKTAVGKVSAIFQKTGSFAVLNSAGQTTTIFWNSATKITGGTLAVGVSVEVKYLEKSGKNWATSIRVPPAEGKARQ